MSQDLLTQLAEYGTYCDERQGSVSADDVIDVIVPLPMPTAPAAPRRGWLVAAAAAALILIVVGGVAWLFPLGGDIAPTDEPAETPTPQTTVPGTTVPATPETTAPPTTLPAGPVEVTVEWTEVTEGNPPHAGPIDRTLGAPFVIDDGTTPRVAILAGTDDTPYSLWTTEDGVSWEETPIALPDDVGDLQVMPSGYWLIGRAALWYSPDLVSGWEAITLDGLTRRELYPLSGEPGILGVAAAGDTTLIAVQYSLEFDWDQVLGIEPGTYEEYDYNWDGDEESPVEAGPTDGIVTLSGRNENVAGSGNSEVWVEEPLLRFIPSTSADGLTLTDVDSEETLFEFPNYDAFDWEDVVGEEVFPRFHTELSALLAVTPDGVETVGPWSGEFGTSPSPDALRLVEIHDGVIVIGRVGGELFDVTSYITRDGASFEAISLPDPTVVYDEASGYLYTPHVDPTFGFEYHWISPDGVNWTRLDTIPDLEYAGFERSTLTRLGDFWYFVKPGADGRVDVQYFSADGEEWYESHDTGMVERQFEQPLDFGDRVLIFGEDSNWVGTVDFGGG